MSATLDKLREEHRGMAQLLDLLSREVQAYNNGGPIDFELVQDILEYSLHFPDTCHHPKEDVVYKRLCERDVGAAMVIGDLAQEHRELYTYAVRFAAAVENILTDHELPREWFSGVAGDFLNLMRRHMQMEEVVFFPAAERALTEEDWKVVDKQIFDAIKPVVDEQTDERYESLRHAVLYAEGVSDSAA